MLVIPFLSWDRIHAGGVAWTDARMPVACDSPSGVRLEVQQARRSGELFVPDRPWEGQYTWGQMIEDDGRYRLYYGMGLGDDEHALCVAESDDGHAWRKPNLRLVEFKGTTDNNVVLTGRHVNNACVFKDPSAPPAERYRLMYFRSWWEGAPGETLSSDEGNRRYLANNAAGPGEARLPVALKGVMAGAASPDGYRWTRIEKPVLEEWHDTHNICRYDAARGKYVAYLRGFYAGRRAISYSETDDFLRWPPSEVVHHHTVTDTPGACLYSNAYTRYPDAPYLHLMFPAVYHVETDHLDAQLAVSLDGRHWERHTERPVITPGARDEGSIYPEPDLLRFRKQGKFRLLYSFNDLHHNMALNESLRGSRRGGFGWAEWEEDRLCGIRADGDGAFAVAGVPVGARLFANVRCEPDGWVRFELTDRVCSPPMLRAPLEGHRFEDAQALTGDCAHGLVTWKGRNSTSGVSGKVVVRIRLHKATIFSLTVVEADDPIAEADPRYLV